MRSLFLRVYLTALAFFIVSFFAILYITNTFIFSKYLPDETTQIYQTIQASLLNKPIKQWQQEINTYNALVRDYDISLLSKTGLLNQQKEALLKQGKFVPDVSIRETNLFILYPLAESDKVLKINENDITGNQMVDLANDIVFFTLFLLPLAFSLYWLVRKLTNPIEYLTCIAQQLGQGDLSVRADKNLLPPMNILAKSFNTMANRLQKTMQEQQVMIGAIPHELRSPLGRIRFALDLTRDKKTLPEIHKQIEKIDTYVDEMQNTVDEVLQLNRLQNQMRVESDEIPLCALLEQLQSEYQQSNQDKQFFLECDISNAPKGNAVLIKHAIKNLLENACRYAQSEVLIKVWQEDNKTFIQVDDNGDGIAKDKRDHIFAPFATQDNSRNRKTGGIGLGLAIVKTIMEKHGGDVQANNNLHGGARLTLFW